MDSVTRAQRYIDSAINAEVNRAASAARGCRNDSLFRAAASLGGWVAIGAMSPALARATLVEAARTSGLAREDGEAAVNHTIDSGLKRGLMSPKSLPPEIEHEAIRGAHPLIDPAVAKKAEERAKEMAKEAHAMRVEARRLLTTADLLESTALAILDNPLAMAELERRRISNEAIARFGLGFCMWPIPTKSWPDRRLGYVPSISIQWRDEEGELDTLQFKHLNDHPVKYHWHEDIGGGKLFNSQVTREDLRRIIVVEGALNAITLWSHGFENVVALPSESGWRPEFVDMLAKFPDVVVALDPGALNFAIDKVVASIPHARVAQLPMDPDDFLIASGGDVYSLDYFFRTAEGMKCATRS